MRIMRRSNIIKAVQMEHGVIERLGAGKGKGVHRGAGPQRRWATEVA
jgi:hypothetical protein